MKKIILAIFALALISEPADAQFLKKLFKKKAKTEKKASKKTDAAEGHEEMGAHAGLLGTVTALHTYDAAHNGGGEES